MAEAEGKASSVAVSEAEVASELGDASGISGNLLFVTVQMKKVTPPECVVLCHF